MTVKELTEKYNLLKDVRDEIEYRLSRIFEDKSDLYRTQEEFSYDNDYDAVERIQIKLNELLEIESNLKIQVKKLNDQIKDIMKQIVKKSYNS